VSDIQTDFPPGKDEPASIADASPARSYANRIVNSWRQAADGMMEVARLCCEASQLLTASEKKQLIKRLPFKEATFSKFVQIGKDARLQKLHARRLLPSVPALKWLQLKTSKRSRPWKLLGTPPSLSKPRGRARPTRPASASCGRCFE